MAGPHTEHTGPGAPFDRGASYIHAAEQGNPWLDVALALGERLLLDPRRRRLSISRSGGL